MECVEERWGDDRQTYRRAKTGRQTDKFTWVERQTRKKSNEKESTTKDEEDRRCWKSIAAKVRTYR